MSYQVQYSLSEGSSVFESELTRRPIRIQQAIFESVTVAVMDRSNLCYAIKVIFKNKNGYFG